MRRSPTEPWSKAPAASSSASPRHLPPRALYVHSPFCARRCPYCDFAIATRRDGVPPSRFLSALALEVARTPDPGGLRWLFVGGGTPTFLSPTEMAEFLDVLRSGFDLSGLREFSVEANPEGLDARYAEILAGGGVTRVSLGAQSFSAATLRMLGRRHDADHIRAAAGAVRAAGIRHLGFDLIVAVPGQTPESLDADLDAAIALAPDHVSVYCLTYEDGTGMTGALRRGRLRAATNDEELAFLRQARGRLEAAGLLRYEISNYARAGARCQHNRTYWRNQAHLGVGPGAVAFVDGVRRKNHPVLAEWCGRLEQGLDPAIERERLEPRAAVGETLMMGLRTTVGVSEKRLRFQHACGFEALDTDAIERLRLQGLVVGQPRRMRLTDRGFELADAIAAELL